MWYTYQVVHQTLQNRWGETGQQQTTSSRPKKKRTRSEP